jgi:hypothetical protein
MVILHCRSDALTNMLTEFSLSDLVKDPNLGLAIMQGVSLISTSEFQPMKRPFLNRSLQVLEGHDETLKRLMWQDSDVPHPVLDAGLYMTAVHKLERGYTLKVSTGFH